MSIRRRPPLTAPALLTTLLAGLAIAAQPSAPAPTAPPTTPPTAPAGTPPTAPPGTPAKAPAKAPAKKPASTKPASTKPTPAKPAAADESASRPFAQRAAEIAKAMADGSPWATGRADLEALWLATVAHVPADHTGTFRTVGLLRRLVSALHATSLPDAQRASTLGFLLQSPRLADQLAALLDTTDDSPTAIFRLLDRLRAAHAAELEPLAPLVAALLVVHDRPLSVRLNENTARAGDPLDLFAYFVQHRADMVFAPDTTPAELLVHLVDAAAPVAELRWAMDRYRGDRQVGNRYSEIRYDTSAFKRGTQKALTAAGLSLPNIKQHGGVCVDQAHFAATVGKAIGVPTAYITGRSTDVGHAWVGYLRTGATPRWDLDTGRYDQYENVRGTLTSPQTGRSMADGELTVALESFALSAEQRAAGVVLLDAVRTLRRAAGHPHPLGRDFTELPASDRNTEPSGGSTPPAAPLPWPPPLPEGLSPVLPAPADLALSTQLATLQAALTLHPGSARGWRMLSNMAQPPADTVPANLRDSQVMTLEQRRHWAGAMEQLTGGRQPDFALQVYQPMIASITDIAEQDRLWQRLADGLRKRPDLACSVRVLQGDMWQRAGDNEKAWTAYADAAVTFADDSPAAVDALASAEDLLRRQNQPPTAALDLYRRAFARTGKPSQMGPEFVRSSNWYRVGSRYAMLLTAAGNQREAERILRQIGER